MSDPAPQRWPTRVVAAATVLAAVLVLWRIGAKSLWYDEAISIGTIDRPAGDALWRITHWEVNQSPYLVLLFGWFRVASGEGWLRALSAVCVVATVPVVHLVGRSLCGAPAGALAALLLALHPLSVQWGQQLRAYALVSLLVVAATLLLLRALDRPDSAGRAVAYGAVAALACYAHFFAAFVVGVHGLWLLVRGTLPRRLVGLAALTGAVCLTPLVVFFVTRSGDPLVWVSPRTRSALRDTLEGLAGGSTAAVVAYGTALVLGAWATWSLGCDATRRSERWSSALPLLWVVAPIVAVTVVSETVKPLLVARFLIVVVPGLALTAGTGLAGLAGLARRQAVGPPPDDPVVVDDARPALAAAQPVAPVRRAAAGVLLVVLLATSAVGVADWYDAPPVDDWRGATETLLEVTPPGTPVLIEPPRAVFAVRYYEERLSDETPRPILRPGVFDPPAGPLIAEIRREGADGSGARRNPIYVEWREQHYVPAEEFRSDGVVVRTYELRDPEAS